MWWLLFVFFVVTAAEDATVYSESDSNLPSVVTDNDIFVGSPIVSTQLAFIDPAYGLYTRRRDMDLPVGKPSAIIISLRHTGNTPEHLDKRFALDTIDAGLRYPRYYEYHIQNFTTMRLQNTLEPGQEASILYKFKPAVELAGRSFDLAIIVHYHDNDGVKYSHSLLNQTISLHEVEEGIDTEMIFLVLLVAALVIAILIGIWHWYGSKYHHQKPKQLFKTTHIENVPTTENEYVALLRTEKMSKKDRPGQETHRRHGRR